MIVDSFRFLPRSFRPFYENPTAAETHEVWAPFGKRLAEAAVSLLTSAGLHVIGEQEPFDAEREGREPTWGDPSFRAIPSSVAQGDLGMMHLHVNNEDVLADHEIALPMRALEALVAERRVGRSTPVHFSVMGYQGGLDVWRNETAPSIVEQLRSQETDGLVLAPV